MARAQGNAGEDGTDKERFLQVVQEAAEIDRDSAERATRAVLQTLAERLSAGEARDIAELLDPDLSPLLGTDRHSEPFDAEEFLRRIAEREGVEVGVATRHARAVLLALSAAIGAEEFDDMRSELPKDFSALLPRGEWVEVMPADEFLRRVADRADLELDAAAAATAAVLETLGERIARGEVEDLIAQLPPSLREPLRRGDALSNGAARRMSLERFVRLVAEREGVDPASAREHVRAVFGTLREAVTPKEWMDVTAQLPDEFAAVSARP